MPAKKPLPGFSNTKIHLNFPQIDKLLNYSGVEFARGEIARRKLRWKRVRRGFQEDSFNELTDFQDAGAKKSSVIFLTSRNPSERLAAGIDLHRFFLRETSAHHEPTPDALRIVSLMKASIHDKDLMIKISGILWLGSSQIRESMNDIMGFVSSENFVVKAFALRSLAHYFDRRAEEIVLAELQKLNLEEEVQFTAAGKIVYEMIESGNKKYLKFISSILASDKNQLFKLAVVGGIKKSLPGFNKFFVDDLVNALHSARGKLRVSLIEALAGIDTSSRKLLISEFSSFDAGLKLKVLEELHKIPDVGVLKNLVGLQKKENDPEVKLEINKVILYILKITRNR